jgi:hypothetical protein
MGRTVASWGPVDQDEGAKPARLQKVEVTWWELSCCGRDLLDLQSFCGMGRGLLRGDAPVWGGWKLSAAGLYRIILRALRATVCFSLFKRRPAGSFREQLGFACGRIRKSRKLFPWVQSIFLLRRILKRTRCVVSRGERSERFIERHYAACRSRAQRAILRRGARVFCLEKKFLGSVPAASLRDEVCFACGRVAWEEKFLLAPTSRNQKNQGIERSLDILNI